MWFLGAGSIDILVCGGAGLLEKKNVWCSDLVDGPLFNLVQWRIPVPLKKSGGLSLVGLACNVFQQCVCWQSLPSVQFAVVSNP